MEPGTSALDSLLPEERAALDRGGLRWSWFTPIAEALARGERPPMTVAGSLEAPRPEDLHEPPPPSSRAQLGAVEAGSMVIQGGGLAVLLLNGGMATRFGGVVKGAVDALPGRSFLRLQAERVRALSERLSASVPLLLMNSTATHGETEQHFAKHGHFGLQPDAVRMFVQSVAPRLRPDGSLYRDFTGSLSLYGPGHGDLFPALQRATLIPWLRARGVQWVLVANVDNLGADPDPAMLGTVMTHGAPLTVELAPKLPGDAGGGPLRVDGRTVLVEGFAVPPSFDLRSVPVFNTNTLWFHVDALALDIPLHTYAVEKEHEGERVVQFERLVGQASWFLETRYLRVSRDRFLPVKSPEDLVALRDTLVQRFPRGGRLSVLK